MNHGVDLSNPHLLGWGVGIPTVHLICILVLRASGLLPEKSKKGSRGSDIFAFAFVASLCVSFLTVTGVLGFFNLHGVVDNADIFSDKFYAQSRYVENYLVYPMLCYQIWNLVVCLLIAEYRTIDAIGHHVVTGCLAYFGLAPYAQYYALFYFGVAELSSIPLNLMDIFKYLPHLSKDYPTLQAAVKASFAAAFFAIRIFVWPLISYELFFGCVDLFKTNTAHSKFVVGFFVFANLFLTFLQFYWGYLIARKALSQNRNVGAERSTNDSKNKKSL